MTNHQTTRTRIATLLNDGLTVRQVAAALNISTQAAYKAMKAEGITPPSKQAAS